MCEILTFLIKKKKSKPNHIHVHIHSLAHAYLILYVYIGCVWPIAEQQSKLVTALIKGEWERPKNIKELCQREITHPHIKQIDTSRHTIAIDYHDYMANIKAILRSVYKNR